MSYDDLTVDLAAEGCAGCPDCAPPGYAPPYANGCREDDDDDRRDGDGEHDDEVRRDRHESAEAAWDAALNADRRRTSYGD